MASVGLIVVGILIVVGTFFMSNILFTPQEANQLELASDICSSPTGSLVGAMDPEIASQCQKAETYSTILSFSPVFYILGGILFIVGLAVGGSKTTVVKETVRYEPTAASVTPTVEPEKTTVEGTVCSNCNKEISIEASFCPHCGTESSEVEVKEKTSKYCNQCGLELKSSESKFCNQCGSKTRGGS